MFDDDFEITGREILVSIIIVAIMAILGVIIGGKINDIHNDNVATYNKSLKIDSKDMFVYGMQTNVGNAFVRGKLIALDTVSYPELNNKKQYMYEKKEKEVYTEHTRIVTSTDSNGITSSHIEVYWTWDYAGSEEIKSKKVSFLGVKFSINKFDIPSSDYIDTIYASSSVRYNYYGVSTKHDCIIFTNLKNNTINNTDFYYTDKTISTLVEELSDDCGIWAFRIAWIILTIIIVCLFYKLRNRWLE